MLNMTTMITNIFMVLALSVFVPTSTRLIVGKMTEISLARTLPQPIERSVFPWIVALMLKEATSPKKICSGTLISKDFVLSGNLFDNFQIH